jgi:hypothetical protein
MLKKVRELCACHVQSPRLSQLITRLEETPAPAVPIRETTVTETALTARLGPGRERSGSEEPLIASLRIGTGRSAGGRMPPGHTGSLFLTRAFGGILKGFLFLSGFFVLTSDCVRVHCCGHEDIRVAQPLGNIRE